jgi:hypothetical protein
MLPVDSFKVIAESVGVQNLKDDVAAALAQDIEYRLRDIIQVNLAPFRSIDLIRKHSSLCAIQREQNCLRLI